MEVFEITGFKTGVSQEGVNFLQPSDSFQNIENGFIHRQVLQSRRGFTKFSKQGARGAGGAEVTDGSRVMGIFQHVLTDGSFETLVCTKSFLYKYNEGTNAFDQITNSALADPLGTGFAIGADDAYVSGTTYPDKDNKDRFVFCSKGMEKIYYYDNASNTVKLFNDATPAPGNVDNPEYAGPVGVTLTTAHYVNFFNGRLNFYYPKIGSKFHPQMVLYSGINDSSGKGDKFNVVGSGELAADTSALMNGVLVLGNSIVLSFSDANWTLDKTSDAFNPYFIKKIPGPIGTNAPFSSVAWGQEVRSLGRTGVISTDSRQTMRVDNRIPFFTQDDVDQDKFDLIYGGFNRANSQFMWSYRSVGQDDSTILQDKTLVNNYEEDTWSIYDFGFSVYGQSNNGQNLTWNDITGTSIEDSWFKWETTEEIWNKVGLNAEKEKTLAGDNSGFIYSLDQDDDDFTASIKTPAITQATQAVLTVDPQGFVVGNKVAISGVTGMTKINNFDVDDPTAIFIPYEVTAVSETTITVDVDTSTFDAADVNTGLVTKLIDFSAELVPFNPFRSQGRKVYVSHVDFLMETNDGFLSVDVYADEEETPFKRNVILKTDNIQKRRQWITMAVNNESEFMTLKFGQINPALQVKVTSIRIYASPGGMTNA